MNNFKNTNRELNSIIRTDRRNHISLFEDVRELFPEKAPVSPTRYVHMLRSLDYIEKNTELKQIITDIQQKGGGSQTAFEN